MVAPNSENGATLFSGVKLSEGRSNKLLRIILGVAVCGITFAAFFLMMTSRASLSPMSSSSDETSLFDDADRYVMRNYDDIKPNSNFLAGLGGLWGIPMVCYISILIKRTL
jgi:hypothetical protein